MWENQSRNPYKTYCFLNVLLLFSQKKALKRSKKHYVYKHPAMRFCDVAKPWKFLGKPTSHTTQKLRHPTLANPAFPVRTGFQYLLERTRGLSKTLIPLTGGGGGGFKPGPGLKYGPVNRPPPLLPPGQLGDAGK